MISILQSNISDKDIFIPTWIDSLFATLKAYDLSQPSINKLHQIIIDHEYDTDTYIY